MKLRRGYLGLPSRPGKSKAKTADTSVADSEILNESVAPTRLEELPTSLFVGYKRTSGNTAQLVAFIGVSDEDSADKPQANQAQVVGVVFDSNGKPVGSFRRGITITSDKGKGGYGSANYQVNLPAGLYQVRIFAREKNGRLGTAHQWLDIPAVKSGQISLSSLYLGEIDRNGAGGESDEVNISANRRFHQASEIRFTTYIYAASRVKELPDLAVQTRILRGDLALTTTPERKLSTDKLTGSATIPYSAQFPLNKLSPGRYRLELIVTDHSNKSTVSQQTDFVVY